jgi:hypothetical protein
MYLHFYFRKYLLTSVLKRNIQSMFTIFAPYSIVWLIFLLLIFPLVQLHIFKFRVFKISFHFVLLAAIISYRVTSYMCAFSLSKFTRLFIPQIFTENPHLWWTLFKIQEIQDTSLTYGFLSSNHNQVFHSLTVYWL